MPADWYCEINGEQHGPVTAGEFRQLAIAGKLLPTHAVWREGMQKKVPAQSVKGLFDSPVRTNTTRRPGGVSPLRPSEDLPEFELLSSGSKEPDLIEFDMVAEIETVEEKPRAAKKPGESRKEKGDDEPAPEILAEAPVTYREGHPDLDGPISGMLTVESTGLRFQFEGADEFRIPFDKIDNVLEPAKGDFPPQMKKKALGTKIGGKAGKLAAGVFGRLIGGEAGSLVEKVGGEAGKMAEKSGDLGKPPRNRIAIRARLRKQDCKVLFDAEGADRDEMTEEAQILFKQIQEARKKYPSAAAVGDTTVNVVVNQAVSESGPLHRASASRGTSAFAAAPTTGKLFRVMVDGQVQGAYSFEQIRGLLSSGRIPRNALIGIETWLPVATLGGLLGSAPAASKAPTSAATESEEEFADYEEIEEEENEEEEKQDEPFAPPPDDGDSIPVDDEFKI